MAQNPKVPQEFWSTYIVEKLYRSNPHLKLCFDESKFVNGGSIVYIPQAGAKPNVVKNRSSLPAAAVQRADTSVFYPLDVWSTDPTTITYQEAQEISYAKQDSVLGDHTATLAEAIGDEISYNWVRGFKPTAGGGSTVEYLPVSRQIPTTGNAEAVNPNDGQTGTRKALTYKEFQTANALFNKDNVGKTDRYAMCESYMFQQLMDSLSSNQMAAFQQTVDLPNGILGKYAGFTFLERSSVLAMSAAGVPVPVGQALAATDNLGCLVWQKNSVGISIGDTELFQRMNDPLYYGDIYSGLIKMGGRCRREDWRGLAVIVQKA
jgi:hypothetical protein